MWSLKIADGKRLKWQIFPFAFGGNKDVFLSAAWTGGTGFPSLQVIKRIPNPGQRHWWSQRHYTSLNLAESISLIPARGSGAKLCPLALWQISGWGFKGKDVIWNSDVLIPSPPRPSCALSLADSLWKSFLGWCFQRQSKKGENHQKIKLLWKRILMGDSEMQEGGCEEKFMGIALKQKIRLG